MKNRLLFILKKHFDYGSGAPPISSGLRNSVSFLIPMLNGLGIAAKMVQVNDNNDIDREVTLYQPTHCFIEAFWVVPEKFDVLIPLHPSVNFIVRDHSETPFLAQEGIAMEWIYGYLKRNVEVNCNSERARRELAVVCDAYNFNERLVTYLPNYYPTPGASSSVPHPPIEPGSLHVGCFGAVRPLKNQLAQAIAAIAYCESRRIGLRFHINATRPEGGGDPILKNLRALFAHTPRHKLIETGWAQYPDFLKIVAELDLMMQVSFSETFNIVSADAVTCAVPVVASTEVSWLGPYAWALPNDMNSMVKQIQRALWPKHEAKRLFQQRVDLTAFDTMSEGFWGARFA